MSLARVKSGDESDKTCFQSRSLCSVSLSSAAVSCFACREIEEALVELAVQATPSLLIHTHTPPPPHLVLTAMVMELFWHEVPGTVTNKLTTILTLPLADALD
jgi:hypothetical protein